MSTIKAIREKLGLTQAELADALGCSQGSVSFYENGKPIPPDTAGRLIDAAAGHGLKLSYDEIYGRKSLSFAKAAASDRREHPIQAEER